MVLRPQATVQSTVPLKFQHLPAANLLKCKTHAPLSPTVFTFQKHRTVVGSMALLQHYSPGGTGSKHEKIPALILTKHEPPATAHQDISRALICWE